ncbi:tumor protein D53 [Aplochiton taeniatus]
METRQQDQYSSVLADSGGEWGKMEPEEDWVDSPLRGGDGGETTPPGESWAHTSLSLSEDWLRPDGAADLGHLRTGLLGSESFREEDEDRGSEVDLSANMTDEEREEIQQELLRLEEEISTLRQVLSSKEQQQSELKQKLGISPLSDFRQNLSRGWTDVQTSTAYKRTSETFSTAGQKTSSAFTTLGSAISRKFGDMRNSPSFKSFEEKVENTVSSMKVKVGGTGGGGGGSFEEVLSSAAHASSQDLPTNPLTDSSERPS